MAIVLNGSALFSFPYFFLTKRPIPSFVCVYIHTHTQCKIRNSFHVLKMCQHPSWPHAIHSHFIFILYKEGTLWEYGEYGFI